MGSTWADKTLTRMDLSEAVFREGALAATNLGARRGGFFQHMSDALVEGRSGSKISSLGRSVCATKPLASVANRKPAKKSHPSPGVCLTSAPHTDERSLWLDGKSFGLKLLLGAKKRMPSLDAFRPPLAEVANGWTPTHPCLLRFGKAGSRK